jgi:hypothetical protein
MRSDAAARGLEQTTGMLWRVERDPWTGFAARGVGGRPGSHAPVPERSAWGAAESFRERNAAILGTANVELRQRRWQRSGRAWHATWQQWAGGLPVYGCYLDLVLAEDGDPVAFRSTLVPGVRVRAAAADADAARRACQDRIGQPVEIDASEPVAVILPGAANFAGTTALQLGLRGRFGARWSALVEAATARVLALDSDIHTELLSGTTTGDVKPLYAADPLATRSFPWLRVGLGNPETSSTYGDVAGSWWFTLNPGDAFVRALLDGRFVSVERGSEGPPSPGLERVAAVPGQVALHFGSEAADDDERTIYYHVNVIHDFVQQRFAFDLLDFPVSAVAAVRNPLDGSPNYANAFWDGNRIGFGNGAGRYQNFGLFADVIYHEYTHAITDYMYRPGGGLGGALGGAIHEALSDYFACTLTDEPEVGEYLTGGPEPLRDLANTLMWPDDRDPGDEVHANGEIFAGALWDVRARTGAAIADAVIHFSRQLFPSDFEAYMQAMLIEDDLLFGDGAPGNGSPHRDAILSGFAAHGMGPLAGRELRIQHVPLRDTETVGLARRVVASLGSFGPGVAGSMTLHWSTDGVWIDAPMQPDAAGEYAAEIPAQPAGALLSYWLSAVRSRPHEEHRLPQGAPDSVFAYRTGPDETPPTIVHKPRTHLPAFSWPADLTVRIDDNLGLGYAFVEYTQDGRPGAKLGLRSSPEDPTLFSTRFPAVGGRPGEVIEYWITAVDASRAANLFRAPVAGSYRVELVQDLEEGFEAGASGWLHRPVVAGHPDPWHETAAANHTAGGSRAWWCGVESGEYPAESAAELLTDWYRIGAGARAALWSRMDAETNGPVFAFDGGVVEIQGEGNLGWESLQPAGGYAYRMSPTNGTNYIPPGTPCLSGTDSDWRRLEFDLGAWEGQRVRLRLLFASDGTPSPWNLRGWLVDDFFLQPGTRDPTDAIASPAASSRILVRPPAPNPCNPSLRFELSLPETAGRVRLDILDPRGRVVAKLLDGVGSPGRLRVVWDGRDVHGRPASSGVYMYRLVSTWGGETGKVVLLR